MKRAVLAVAAAFAIAAAPLAAFAQEKAVRRTCRPPSAPQQDFQLPDLELSAAGQRPTLQACA